MNTILTDQFLVVATAAAILAMCSAYCARIAPQPMLARARGCPDDDGRKTCDAGTDGSGGNMFNFVEQFTPPHSAELLQAPSWAGFLSNEPMRARPLQFSRLPSASTVTDGKRVGDECLEANSRTWREHGVYVEISKILDGVGPDHLDDVKRSVSHRYPGHRKLIKKASIEEAAGHDDEDTLAASGFGVSFGSHTLPAKSGDPADLNTSPDKLDEDDEELFQHFVEAFEKCDHICVAVLLRDSLKPSYPEEGDKQLIDLAYTKVYGG